MVSEVSMTQTPQIKIIAEPIAHIGAFTITNSMVLGSVGVVLFLGILAYARLAISRRHYSRLAMAVLWVFEWLLDTSEEVLGSRSAARKVAPLGITMFMFLVINNWLEILPVVGPVSFHGKQLLRGLAADMNFTFSLAIITFVAAQLWAIQRRGFFGNIRRYFANPLRNPIGFFEIMLEVVAEFSRTIALSMRLFGNIFGGEVLLLVVGFVASWAAPLALPIFMVFELFIGAVQAYIFFMLTITFISLAAPVRQIQPHRSVPAGVIN
jgi:F-type H+-transporting ATPase subunit a